MYLVDLLDPDVAAVVGYEPTPPKGQLVCRAFYLKRSFNSEGQYAILPQVLLYTDICTPFELLCALRVPDVHVQALNVLA